MDLENKITSKEIVETGLGREDIKRNLNDLIKIGWVKEIRLANLMYSLNLEDHYIISLITFFKEVGYIGFI
jgi:hypothetical protein